LPADVDGLNCFDRRLEADSKIVHEFMGE
jgi:hypothetical protein